jgi:hypothetical protein
VLKGLIKDPTTVYERYLKNHGVQLSGPEFERGRLAMALEVITLIRAIETMGEALADFEREQLISLLQTFLVKQGISEAAWQTYGVLMNWRRVSVVPEPSPAGSADVDRPAFYPASPGAMPPNALSPASHTAVPPGSDRSQDPPSQT